MQMPHTSCLESKSSISLILSSQRDLDPRPSAWQADALPTELQLHIERVTGIGPVSEDWKSPTLTIVLYSQNEILIIDLALLAGVTGQRILENPSNRELDSPRRAEVSIPIPFTVPAVFKTVLRAAEVNSPNKGAEGR